MPYLEEDDDGSLFIMGYRIAPDSDESYSDLKIKRCPVAGANQCTPLLESYHRHKDGLFDLSSTYPNPSVALLQCFDILDYNYKLLENRIQKRKLEEMKNG